MAAQRQLGLLVVLQGNKPLQLPVLRCLPVGAVTDYQLAAKSAGALQVQRSRYPKVEDAKLPRPVQILWGGKDHPLSFRDGGDGEVGSL